MPPGVRLLARVLAGNIFPLHRAGQVKARQERLVDVASQGPPSILGQNVFNTFQTDAQKK